MAHYYTGPPDHLEGEGPDDPRVFECQVCGEATSNAELCELVPRTHDSPAEHGYVCMICMGTDEQPEDREPTEDELEARR